VDKAVAAAKQAFESYSETSPDDRLVFLERIIEVYKSKMDEMAETISLEMGGAPNSIKGGAGPSGPCSFFRDREGTKAL